MNTYNKIMLLAFYAFIFICITVITFYNLKLIIEKPLTSLIYIALLITIGYNFVRLFKKIKW